MATQCKLQRKNSPQSIPPGQWTLITYDTVLRADSLMQHDLETITPDLSGDVIWERNISWASITQPLGDTRVRQFLARFIRDPYGIRDDTGASDQADTAGRDFHTGGWIFYGRAGQPVGVEVWHDHTDPVDVTQAQFSATTWDF